MMTASFRATAMRAFFMPERFAILVAELKEAWVARMGDLIAALRGKNHPKTAEAAE